MNFMSCSEQDYDFEWATVKIKPQIVINR